jgi:hypothetical protein
MPCTILSSPRALPTNSLQLTQIHHHGLVRPIPLVHPHLLPVIPSTQTATCRITCSPFTTTRTPSRTIPLRHQMVVSPSMFLGNPSVLGRAHREAPQVRSSHPIGSSSYSSARCAIICSHDGLVLRANPLISSDDSCFSVSASSRSRQRHGIPHRNKVRNSHHEPQ